MYVVQTIDGGVSVCVLVVVVVVAFSSCARLWGECSTLVEISSRKLNPLFSPGSVHNGSAS